MKYQIVTTYTNKQYYLILLNNNIVIKISKTEDYYFGGIENIDRKEFRIVNDYDIPEWVLNKVNNYIQNKEEFIIKFEHLLDSGFWAKEEIDFDCVVLKQDTQLHEIAKNEFQEQYKEKYNQLKIICCVYC